MAEQGFKIVGNDLVFRVTAPRALRVLRERSRASGGDGGDEAALDVLLNRCCGELQHDLESLDEYSNASLANSLVGDAMQACVPHGGESFIALTVEELWAAAQDTIEWLHQEYGRSDAAEQLVTDAVEAALREDGAETLRLVRAAVAEWRAFS